MKTPKDFDYDIWKDDDGHYFIRVKRTGEVTRVSEEIVREMWREIHRMERHRKNTTILDEDGNPHARILSLDDSRVANSNLLSIQNEPWLVSKENAFERIELEMLEQNFLKTLTENQRRVYHLRFKMGLTVPECAEQLEINIRNTFKLIAQIRKKAKKFF